MKDNDKPRAIREIAGLISDYRNSIIQEGNKILKEALRRYPGGDTARLVSLSLMAVQAEALGISIAITVREGSNDPDNELEVFIKGVTCSVREHTLRRYEQSRPRIQ
jgi:hypothetical protein